MGQPAASPPQIHRPGTGGPVSLPIIGVASGASLLVALAAESRVLGLVALLVPAFLLGLSNPRFLRRVLLVIVAVEIPLQIDRFIGNQPREEVWESISGFNVSLTTIALVGLIWLWVLEVAAGTTTMDRTRRSVVAAAIAYFLVVVASLFVAIDLRMSLYEVVIVGQALVLLAYIAVAVRDRDDIVLIVVALAGSVVLQGLLAVWLTVGPSNIDFGFVRASRDGRRVGGTFLSPNALGGFLVLVLPSMIGLTVGGPTPLTRLIGGVASAFATLTLVLTFSRGAWLGAAVGVSIALWIAWKRRWVDSGFVVMVMLALGVVAAVMGTEILSRLSALDNAAVRARLPLIDLAWDMITAHPVLGVGANNFASALPEFLTSDFSQVWISTVHNKYLLVLSETGVVGLLAFLWFLGAGLGAAIRSTKTHDASLAAIGAGIAAGMTGHMVHMLFDIFHSRAHVHALWLMIGLAAAASMASPVTRRPQLTGVGRRS